MSTKWCTERTVVPMFQTMWVNGLTLENGRFDLKFMAKKVINITYYYPLNN